MELYKILYDLVSIVVVLGSLVAFLVTTNLVFPEIKDLVLKCKFVELKQLFYNRPIRATFTAISFLIFISMTLSYPIPVDITGWMVIRTFIVRVPLLIATLIILWACIHIKQKDWQLSANGNEDDVY